MAIKIEQHDDMTRTFSDTGFYILEAETGLEIREAWNPIDNNMTYTETDRLIADDEPTFTQEELEEAAALLRAAKLMLGGDE